MPPTPLVLMIDDNPMDIGLVAEGFAEIAFAVELARAENGAQAYTYMRQAKPTGRLPRLVILDLNLPIIRGQAILGELRQDRAWRRIPIVVLTSTERPGELEECRRGGAVACFTKPSAFGGYVALARGLRALIDGDRNGRRRTSSSGQDPSGFERLLLSFAGGVAAR